MSKSYEEKVEGFTSAINKTMSDEGEINLRAAILYAHKYYRLNAADDAGGIGSAKAAWQEAAKI